MTTLNTIIEEEKKEFDEIALYSDGTIHMGGSRIDKLMTWFTSAMQRAYEAGLHSQQERLMSEVLDRRDTLEKAYQKAKGEPVTEQILEFALVQVDAVIEKIKQ